MTLVLDSDDYLHHEPVERVERPARLRAVRVGLDDAGLFSAVDVAEPEPVDRALLERVHDPDHVAEVEDASRSGGGRFAEDTVATAGTWKAVTRAAGGAVAAAEAALDGEPAFSISRPPGHHATRDEAMGFCFFDFVAVAAEAALDRGCDRVAIVDHDVHHGNGTQDILYDRDDVLFASVHQSPLYPGTGDADETGTGPGEGYTVNVPVPAGVGDEGYLRILDEVVLPVLEAYDPDLLLVSAGFDAHHRDPLGGLELSSGCYARIARRLLAVDAPAAFVLEGGYDFRGLARGVASQVAVLADVEVPSWEEDPPPGTDVAGVVERVLEVHGGRWPVG